MTSTTYLRTLWIQEGGEVFLYGLRYVDHCSILELDTLLIDVGGLLHIVVGDSYREPVICHLGLGSLPIHPLDSDLFLLMNILEKDIRIYKLSNTYFGVTPSAVTISSFNLLTDSMRELIHG